MQLIATYGTIAAAKQVETKRVNSNLNPRIKYVISRTLTGYQLWSYKKGEQN